MSSNKMLYCIQIFHLVLASICDIAICNLNISLRCTTVSDHHRPVQPTVLFVVIPKFSGSCGGGGGALGILGFAGSTKITQPSKNLAFIPSRAFSASSIVS
uniref:Putative ovule protein n=1 Tax=Solanum chacoense TaxID=4108 RepID=A0A0V0HXI5_SOLCH